MKKNRMDVRFGESVPQDQRIRDRAEITNYAARLAALTELDIGLTRGDPNFFVLVLNERDRLGYGAELRKIIPGIDSVSVNRFLDLSLTDFCLVLAFGDEKPATYTRAVALIRGEHPALLRRSCVHEELAQGLGLANDSPRANPSIFNDDEEFALLTLHDEYLLRILYDNRLRPGMDAKEARPIVNNIAREYLAPPAAFAAQAAATGGLAGIEYADRRSPH